nr:PREDICTED: ribosomal RNA small subunit methyltransferase NEP1-like [Anolis carolinensis]|eukprot:XP_008118460.1 PREDICTED: ribosomal RNA small subunit methyltransferase NEP1-like [Anolis carolinensis]
MNYLESDGRDFFFLARSGPEVEAAGQPASVPKMADDSSRKRLSADKASGPDSQRAGRRRLLVILEGASLETVKVGKTYELLNCDKHKSLLLRNGRDPGVVRPDITHQVLPCTRVVCYMLFALI